MKWTLIIMFSIMVIYATFLVGSIAGKSWAKQQVIKEVKKQLGVDYGDIVKKYDLVKQPNGGFKWELKK